MVAAIGKGVRKRNKYTEKKREETKRILTENIECNLRAKKRVKQRLLL